MRMRELGCRRWLGGGRWPMSRMLVLTASSDDGPSRTAQRKLQWDQTTQAKDKRKEDKSKTEMKNTMPDKPCARKENENNGSRLGDFRAWRRPSLLASLSVIACAARKCVIAYLTRSQQVHEVNYQVTRVAMRSSISI